ncbi:MAG: metal-dependent hydrolase [Rhodospirillaceae bacterium]
MDLITQGVFGAVVGQAGFRAKLGRRAVVVGLAAGLLPDMDFLIGTLFGDFAYWRHHRGMTHSLLFAPLVAPLMAWVCAASENHWRKWRKRNDDIMDAEALKERRRIWWCLWFFVLISHPFLDLFTSYGTQLLYPLSDHRFAIDALPIVDPVYTLPLIVVMIAGLLPTRWVSAVKAQKAAIGVVFFAALYTLFGWQMENRAIRAAETLLPPEVPVRAIHAYPTLFQPYWRRVVAYGVDGQSWETHLSAVTRPDSLPAEAWVYRRSVPEDHPAVSAVMETWRGFVFHWFVDGRALWRVTPAEPGAEGPWQVEGLDLRYWAEGADQSFWGLEATVLADGTVEGLPDRLRSARPGGAIDFWALYSNGLFGRDPVTPTQNP